MEILSWPTTILAIAILSASNALGEKPRFAVSPNVLVSRAHPKVFHGEIWFAADPNDARRLMGGSMFYDPAKNSLRSVAYVSKDGGETWASPFETGESTDPACVYGIDGTAYWLHLNREAGGGMEIFRSKDNGQTWRKPVIATYLDREYMTVDDTSGKHRGRLYINAHQAGEGDPQSRVLTLLHSDDGGERFSDITTTPGPPRGFANPGNGVILSDGTFATAFADLAKRAKPDLASGLRQLLGSIGFASSKDGERLGAPSRISDWYYPIGENNRLSYMPVIAIDRSKGAFRDRLYVVWVDSRSGRAEIYLSWSGDRGATWSGPKAVNDDSARPGGSGPNNLHATVAVNREGVVGVSWYDRRENPDDRGWRQRFAASLDGGVTFSDSLPVSAELYDPARNEPISVNEQIERTARRSGIKSMGPRWIFAFNGGDTASLVADANGAFHAFWADNRTGTAQLWTSVITIEPPVK